MTHSHGNLYVLMVTSHLSHTYSYESRFYSSFYSSNITNLSPWSFDPLTSDWSVVVDWLANRKTNISGRPGKRSSGGLLLHRNRLGTWSTTLSWVSAMKLIRSALSERRSRRCSRLEVIKLNAHGHSRVGGSDDGNMVVHFPWRISSVWLARQNKLGP